MFIVLTAILMISYAIIPVIAASAAPTSGAHKYKGIRKKRRSPEPRTYVVELLFLHCVLQSGYTMVYTMICHDGIRHDYTQVLR